MDKRLLDAGEIETIWNQLSTRKLSDAMFRFAGEIAMAQLKKIKMICDKDDLLKLELERRQRGGTFSTRTLDYNRQPLA